MMPIYEHKCLADGCDYEWEGTFRISTKVMDIVCPSCNTTGKAKRLISLPAPGRVELTGQELVQQVKSDAKKMKNKVMTDENVLANMVGEEKYHKNKLARDKNKGDA